MLNLSYDAIHRFVSGHPNAEWEGWDMLYFKPNPTGYFRENGAFRNGEWGIMKRVSPNAEGRWLFSA